MTPSEVTPARARSDVRSAATPRVPEVDRRRRGGLDHPFRAPGIVLTTVAIGFFQVSTEGRNPNPPATRRRYAERMRPSKTEGEAQQRTDASNKRKRGATGENTGQGVGKSVFGKEVARKNS